MQAEVKVVLQDATDFSRARESLRDTFNKEENHENHFFDGPNDELMKSGSLLRVRFVSGGTCTVALKEHNDFEGGTSMRWAKECPIDGALGRAIVKNPQLFFGEGRNEVVGALETHFKLKSLKYLGGFNTKRAVYSWATAKSQPNLVLRLDHTTYPFGERFEIEVPGIVVPVHDVIDELSAALASLGVRFAVAQQSKLQHLVAGKRAAVARSHMIQDAKVLLADTAAFECVRQRLQSSFIGEVLQQNYFFDGTHNELAKAKAHLRIRITGDQSCVAVLKEHASVDDGSAMYWGQEVPLTAADWAAIQANPNYFLEGNNAISQTLRAKFHVTGLQSVGQFENKRYEYNWSTAKSQPNLVLRLDHTTYPFGERFEIEVPGIVVPVHDVIDELSAALADLGVACELGHENKFACFLKGIRSGLMSQHQSQSQSQ